MKNMRAARGTTHPRRRRADRCCRQLLIHVGTEISRVSLDVDNFIVYGLCSIRMNQFLRVCMI
jgi:hypothetical protein